MTRNKSQYSLLRIWFKCSRDDELAEKGGLTPRGKVEGFNEMLSIQHFDLPEGMRSGEIMFQMPAYRKARQNGEGKPCS